ncbi:LAGLIDADG family homing endonuclease [Hydrogenophaga palleronii]|uniref:LAGLIDADG family homing endonuclease n=1 Tax=Hydrogenophaga palleronii TaxID=65655 RepID=UPI000825E0F7|nr:LAGLIDADG family homing endonuclease [Hydrogenophaga palleronii]
MTSNHNSNSNQKPNQIEEFATGLEHFAAELHKHHALQPPHGAPQPMSVELSIPPAPSAYISDPMDEFTNVCGELLDPLSVIRVTAHISAAQPFGSIASEADQHFLQTEMAYRGGTPPSTVDLSGCMSLVRLGAGDQSVLLPSVHGTRWIPEPGVYELELMKHAVPNVPSDVLVLQQFGKAFPGPATTPWVLRHLGLLDTVEQDLHRVLASLKPVHQAFLMAALSRPDIEAAQQASTAPAGRYPQTAGRSFVLRAGILAAMRMNAHDLDRDEASLVRLAAVLADLGALDLPNKPPLVEPSSSSSPSSPSRSDEMELRRRAHPDTVLVLRALLSRLETLEPEDASRLRALWSGEGERPFRLGSRFGPLSRNPVDPDVARLGCALGDALSRARDEDHRRLSVPRSTQDDQGDGRYASDDAGARSAWVVKSVPAPAHAVRPVVTRPPVPYSKGEGGSTSGGSPAGERHPAPQRRAIFPRTVMEHELMEAVCDALDDPNDIFLQEQDVIGESHAETDHEPSDDAHGGDSGDAHEDASGAGEMLSCSEAATDTEELVRRKYSVSRMPPSSLDWAAGMLDGDGCIAIVKQPFRHRKTIYRLVVCIVQNCRQTLEHFQKCLNLPGTIYEVARKLQHNKQVYTLNYSGPNAMRLVQMLQGHLVRKRLEAAVALSFCENGQISRRFGCHGVPPHIHNIRVAHYKKLRALK